MSNDLREWFMRQADYLPKILTTPGDIGEGYFKSLGYQRLLMSVQNPNTGETLACIQTYRKPEEFEQLVNELVSVAVMSSELLEKLGFTFASPDGTTIKETNAQNVLTRRILGGKKKQDGISPTTAKKYEKIASAFQKSGLSEREYCAETGVKLRTLNRAIKHCATNASATKS